MIHDAIERERHHVSERELAMSAPTGFAFVLDPNLVEAHGCNRASEVRLRIVQTLQHIEDPAVD